MVVGIVLLVMVVALGVAAACGRLPDTRDPEYSLGRLLAPPARRPDRTG